MFGQLGRPTQARMFFRKGRRWHVLHHYISLTVAIFKCLIKINLRFPHNLCLKNHSIELIALQNILSHIHTFYQENYKLYSQPFAILSRPLSLQSVFLHCIQQYLRSQCVECSNFCNRSSQFENFCPVDNSQNYVRLGGFELTLSRISCTKADGLQVRPTPFATYHFKTSSSCFFSKRNDPMAVTVFSRDDVGSTVLHSAAEFGIILSQHYKIISKTVRYNLQCAVMSQYLQHIFV